ncbi:zinc finger protein MEP-1 isoform X8 [Oratosquilla oratoria]|uniref:zinc finger protein MEP-1 isoform X8 n=1 Tax=Oratosquilla oratoria TaxID=337810 RepID=UPI003F770607
MKSRQVGRLVGPFKGLAYPTGATMAEMAQESVTEHRLTPEGTQGVGYANPEKMKALNGLDKEVNDREMENGIAEEPKVNGEAESIEMKLVSESSTEKPQAPYDSNLHRVERNDKPEGMVAYDGDGGGGSKEKVEHMDVVEHGMEKLHEVKEREGRHEVAGSVDSVREVESEPMEVEEGKKSYEGVTVQEREVVKVKEAVEPKVVEKEREVEKVEDKYKEVSEDSGEKRLENRVDNRVENKIQKVVQDRIDNKVAKENEENVKDKVEDNAMDIVKEKNIDKVEDRVEVKEKVEERGDNKVDHRAEKKDEHKDEHKEKSREDKDEKEKKENKDNDSEKDTEKEREEGKTKDSCDNESAATETKDETNTSSANSTSASSPTSPKTLTSKPTKDSMKKKDKTVTTVTDTSPAATATVPDDDEIKELTTPTKRTTRSATRKLMDDDDDCKITNEVVKSKYRDDESDIEMIEESDPLAISDADVKKAKQSKERDRSHLVGVSTQEESTRLCKILEILNAKGKKDPNVIIIDTNTLLKNQGNLAAAVAASGGGASSTSSVSTGTQSSVGSAPTPSMSIQTAIQAITGGMPAQGLQSAYITALQQVLLAQGGQVPMNPQHLAQLQQYYQSLGALEDDAYVIEAPSFIVPYVMEGKPKETIKDFLKRINKEHEEFEKKREQELLEKQKEEKAAEEEAKKAEEKAVEEKEGESGEKDKDVVERKEPGKEDKENEKVDDAKEKLLKDKEEDKDKETEKTKKVDASSEKDVDNSKKDGKDSSKDEDDNKENRENKDKGAVVGEAKKEEEKKDDLSHLGRWEPYYRSALGKFFLELGLNQAEEFLQSDLLRMSKRKMEKMKSSPSKEDMMAVKILEKQLEKTRAKNAHLTVPLKTCKFCSFKSESDLVMERHLESPHMVNYTYKCNFCDFETRGPQVILFHMEAEHNVRGRLERAPAFFQCALCPYEDNNKSKMTRHSLSCAKKFKPERNCEITDWEPPAKIPKLPTLQILRGRPNTLGKAFEPVRMPNLLPKGMGLSQNIQQGMASQLAAQGRGRGRPVGSYKTTQPIVQRPGQSSIMYQTRTQSNVIQQVSGTAAGTQQFTLGNQLFHTGAQKKTAAQISSPKKKDYRYQLVNGHLVPMSASSGGGASTTVSSVSLSSQSTNRVPRLLPSTSTSVSLIPGLAASSSITIQPHVVLQSVQSKGGSTKSPQQPSISITPLPRNNQSSSATTKSSSSSSSNTNAASRDGSGKPSFVICEICDGYIKDLEQLRNHMNLIHKVKIHPKMIYNRPPLNCQKCQHRFFTDQGLERHLLGTHGLVTSSMQEAANKGKDAGRCPICGKVFQWKLLNHVSRDHKMTLKPAHLSYKCTVCTATFNMYRLFENHVYSAHSVVNKNKGDSNSSSSKRSGASDSPLKINDEITIIPQPASKSVKVDHKSAASKKMDSTPTVSKEITITKVGAKIQRRSGDGVEIINLDDSPAKKAGDLTPKRRSTREAAYVAAKRVKLDA